MWTAPIKATSLQSSIQLGKTLSSPLLSNLSLQRQRSYQRKRSFCKRNNQSLRRKVPPAQPQAPLQLLESHLLRRKMSNQFSQQLKKASTSTLGRHTAQDSEQMKLLRRRKSQSLYHAGRMLLIYPTSVCLLLSITVRQSLLSHSMRPLWIFMYSLRTLIMFIRVLLQH